MRLCRVAGCWLLLLLAASAAQGQSDVVRSTTTTTTTPRDSAKAKEAQFPGTAREFALEVNRRFEALGHPDGNRLNAIFVQTWADRKLLDGDLVRMARTANQLLADGHPLYPVIGQYVAYAAYLTRPDRHIRFTLTEYFNLIDAARTNLTPREVAGLMGRLQEFLPSGLVRRDANYRIRLQRAEGSLAWLRGTTSTGMPYAYPGVVVHTAVLSLAVGADSIAIEQAKGRLNLLNGTFLGSAGKYDLQRLGKTKQELSFELNKFTMVLDSSGFVADSAVLFYPQISRRPVVGKLIEPLAHLSDASKAVTPIFVSRGLHHFLSNVQRGVDFEGGFTMRGLRLEGYGTDSVPARIVVKRGDTPILRMATKRIDLSAERLQNDRNAVTIFLPDGDSLYHPSMRFAYEPAKLEMFLSKDLDDPLYRQPMTSSFHRYDFYFEALRWNTEQDTMIFAALVDQANKVGAIESQDYFLRERFNQYNGLLPFNSLGLIYNYVMELRAENLPKARAAAAEAKAKAAEVKETTGAEVDEYGFPIASGGGSADDWGTSDWGTTDWDEGADTGADTGAESGSAGAGGGKAKPKSIYLASQSDPLEINPLRMVVDLNDILKHYRFTNHTSGFREALYRLWAAGFVDYWPTRQHIRPTRKLINWNRAARRLKDHDVMQVVSRTPVPNNAVLNFVDKTMRINGVESFQLSDSQNVIVRPQAQSVIVRNNRNMEFGGIVYAGKVDLYGRGSDKFRFDYTNFKIDALQLDSVKFYPQRDPNFNPRANPRLTKALQQFKIEEVVGSVYINKPSNKSGKRPVRGYPVFDCYTTAYVFWSRPEVQGGEYKKGKVNFALDPFSLDSLENFDISGLEFQGEFAAGDVVPAFRDTLKPVSDNTYGINQVFADGVELYKGKGRFTNTLQMDNYGLHGKGQIEFLVTKAEADTFLFHMDSVMAQVKQLDVKEQTFEGVYFPTIKGKNLKYRWYVRRGVLELHTTDTPIELHDGNALFSGKLRITRKGALGSGLVVSGQTQLEGDSIDLSELQIKSANATYRIASRADSTKFDVVIHKAQVTQDVKNRKAEFFTEDPGSPLIEFPLHRYQTSLAQGNYDERTGSVILEARYPEGQLNQVISTDPALHKLAFAARRIEYRLDDRRIQASGVDSFLVADAAIYPAEQKLVVDPKGALEKLAQARIVADTVRRYHTITEAEVEVRSRYEYRASGYYPYRTAGVKEQAIFLSSIYVRADTTTYARGQIKAEQEFLISDRIFFRDSVELRARNRFLGFAGEVRIQSSRPYFADSWFGFRDPNVNPDTVFVPIVNPRNKRTRQELVIGLTYRPVQRLFQTKFFAERTDARRDKDVLLARGGLTYDRQRREFRVGPKAKIDGLAYKGNVVSYDDELDVTSMRGKLDIPFYFPPGSARVEAAGSWRQDGAGNFKPVLSRMALRIQIPGIGDAIEDLARKFALYSTGSPDINFQDPEWIETMSEFLDADSLSRGEPNTQAVLQQINAGIVVPADLRTNRYVKGTFVLSDVRFQYNDSVKGFWCSTPVSVLSIGDQQINKLMDAKIEYRFSRTLPDGTPNSDTLRLYLQTDDVSWMFFEIRGRQIRMVSSEASFNAIIQEINDKGGPKPAKKDEEPVELYLLKESDKTQYIRRFSRYLFMR